MIEGRYVKLGAPEDPEAARSTVAERQGERIRAESRRLQAIVRMLRDDRASGNGVPGSAQDRPASGPHLVTAACGSNIS